MKILPTPISEEMKIVESCISIEIDDFYYMDTIKIDPVILKNQPNSINYIKLEIEAHLAGMVIAIKEHRGEYQETTIRT